MHWGQVRGGETEAMYGGERVSARSSSEGKVLEETKDSLEAEDQKLVGAQIHARDPSAFLEREYPQAAPTHHHHLPPWSSIRDFINFNCNKHSPTPLQRTIRTTSPPS